MRIVAVTFNAIKMRRTVVIKASPTLGRRAAPVNSERAFGWSAFCPGVSRIFDARDENHQSVLRGIGESKVIVNNYTMITSVSSRTRNGVSACTEVILPSSSRMTLTRAELDGH
jgi:hypothetical protein